MEIEDSIRDMIVKELRWAGPTADLTNSYGLLDNGVIDSQGIFQLVGLLEERYDIEIDDEDLVPENFETIGDVASLVRAKRG